MTDVLAGSASRFAGSTPPRPRRVRASSAHRSARRPSTAASAARSRIRAAPFCPASPSPSPASTVRPPTTVVTNESGLFVKERLLPGAYKVQAELHGLQDRGRAARRGRRRLADAGASSSSKSGSSPTQVDGHRRRDAAHDRSRRRRDALRLHADHRSAGARSQLHQVHAADAGHAAAAVAARGEREPAGLDADDGQRPALQRHELSARRHRQPRSDPRHHRHQPDAGVDRRDEDHVAELRRGVRPGRRRRGLGADAIGQQHAARQRLRVLPERRVPGAQPVHAVPAPIRSPAASFPRPRRNQFGGVDRRADRAEPLVLLRRLPGDASHAGRIAAAVGPDRGGARRRSQRLRRQHLRSGRPASSSPATVSRGPAVAAGAAHPRSDPDAERHRARQRHARQLRGRRRRSRSTRTR